MTNQQIAETLKSKGFDTKIDSGGVIVSLNCPINVMEVGAALDCDIPQGTNIVEIDDMLIAQIGDRVVVAENDN